MHTNTYWHVSGGAHWGLVFCQASCGATRDIGWKLIKYWFVCIKHVIYTRFYCMNDVCVDAGRLYILCYYGLICRGGFSYMCVYTCAVHVHSASCNRFILVDLWCTCTWLPVSVWVLCNMHSNGVQLPILVCINFPNSDVLSHYVQLPMMPWHTSWRGRRFALIRSVTTPWDTVAMSTRYWRMPPGLLLRSF